MNAPPTSLTGGALREVTEEEVREVLQRLLSPIAERLRRLESEVEHLVCSELGEFFPDAARLIDGGKRLRGAICIGAAVMAAGSSGASAEDERISKAVRVGACVEGIHFASLLHDDVIDEALERRGVATLHRSYGSTGAILAGDLLYVRIINRLLEMKDPELLRIVTTGTASMVEGEAWQTLGALKGEEVDARRYEEMITRKTAAFFSACARAGAHIGADGEKGNGGRERYRALQRIMDRFGRAFGIAFQMIDDILDWSGEEELVGKDLLLDIRGGKLTLPVILFREAEPKKAKGLLRRAEEGEVLPLVDAIRQGGYVEKARLRAREFAEEALEALEEVEEYACDPALFRNLVNFAVYRVF